MRSRASRRLPPGSGGPLRDRGLGCTVAISVQVVGGLLVLALLCTPAAAAIRITSSPVWMPLLSVVFAFTAMLAGILLALGTAIPISPYVTTVSFLIYLACRVIAARPWTHLTPALGR
jgi:zinc/manganese transport system permease protein